MNLTNEHYRELIKAATARRLGWVPAGPLHAARYKQLLTYRRANVLAALEKAGLVTLTETKSQETATIRLTEAGKQAIRDMPDDLHAEWFPLPIDIAEAKAKVSKNAQKGG